MKAADLHTGRNFVLLGEEFICQAMGYHPDGSVAVSVNDNPYGIKGIDFAPGAEVDDVVTEAPITRLIREMREEDR